MAHEAEFRRCLLECDVTGIRRLWRHVSPHLAQPNSDDQALEMIHMARVDMKTCPPALREYSKRWLDERRRTVVALAVGVSVRSTSNRQSDRAAMMERAMSGAVLDCLRDGIPLDAGAAEVKRRMHAAAARA